MDALDRRIVAELQKDGSLSNSQLAERVGSTAPSCWRRVRQLEDQGVLRETVRLAQPLSLGQTVQVMCHARLKSHTTESVEAFESMVRAEPRVMECHSMSGDWDYLMQIVTEDVAAYESFLMNSLLKHPSVAGASSNFALRTVKYTTALPIKV
ncbi:Lrp/AsnC family transcriptional regulator [Novosphingobium sp. BL-8A]|uniref:Lrp/AsnC family transcriptional regulator n=1 Tax=Novosphingobium sp. BL-8A TaxID=3127639 RepID=UPI003757DF2F